jgi:hypothetical protein
MNAFAGEHLVPLESIELDDIGWDRADTHGEHEMVLLPTPADLQSIGEYLYARMQSCIAEEADYFDDDDMRDTPLPGSPDFLVKSPELLTRYFEEPFWRRDIILAVMACIDAQREHKVPRHWLQEFRGLMKMDGRIGIVLGIHVGPLYLNRQAG